MSEWRLWLDDERSDRVRRALAALGQTLLDFPTDKIPGPPGLVSGMPGLALAHAYLARAGVGDAHEERCYELLERSVAEASGLAGDCSLAAGLAGFAFVLEHLGANEEDDTCAELDDIIAAEVERKRDMPAELLWGVAGLLVYARERLPRGRPLHDALVARLLAMARPQPGGDVAWFADPDPRFVGTPMLNEFPEGSYNLGVAHGNPGILTPLASIDDDERAQAAARAAMRWLWAQRFPTGPASFSTNLGSPPYATHGWCYGDEGIGGTLLAAARALDDAEWQARAVEIPQRRAALAPTVERGYTFCHGAAGTMHVWHRAWQATGEPAFRQATTAWLDALLDGVGPEEFIGLLNGTAGIALPLAALVSDIEPGWDRLFALSLRR